MRLIRRPATLCFLRNYSIGDPSSRLGLLNLTAPSGRRSQLLSQVSPKTNQNNDALQNVHREISTANREASLPAGSARESSPDILTKYKNHDHLKHVKEQVTGIRILPDKDDTVKYEKLLNRPVPRFKVKAQEIAKLIGHHRRYVQGLNPEVIKTATSQELFSGVKVSHSWLDPVRVPDSKVFINRIGSIRFLMENGIEARDIDLKHLAYTADILKKRLKMLKECGMVKLDIDHIHCLTNIRTYDRVTSMVPSERRKFFKQVNDPELLATNMVNSIHESVISKREKDLILSQILPHVNDLCINSLKVKAINTILNSRRLPFPLLNISQINTELLDLEDCFKTINILADSKECSAMMRLTNLWPLFNRMESKVLEHLLDTVPYIGCTHVSHLFIPKFVNVFNTIEKVNFLRDRLDYLLWEGFSDVNISGNYQIFYLNWNNVLDRMDYWYKEMGQEHLATSANSLKLITNYGLAKDRYEATDHKKASIGKLTHYNSFLASKKYRNGVYKRRVEMICLKLGLDSREFYEYLSTHPNLDDLNTDKNNAQAVYNYLTLNCGFPPQVLVKKSYVLFLEYERVKKMYESRLIADPDYEEYNDQIKLDLICYHLTSFKDYFELNEKTENEAREESKN